MVAEPSCPGVKTEKVPSEWLKPFSAKWMLCRIAEACTESEAKAILKNWIYKTWVEEVVDKLVEGMRRVDRTRALGWLDELQ